MNSDKSLRTIFNEALDLNDAAARERFLEEACGADAALRERVEKLLHAHDEADGFLPQASAPAIAAKGTVVLPRTEKIGDQIGRYKLLQEIGEGGCGVVYMAEQSEPVRRRVALKVVKLGMDTKQVIARFEAERQALAMLDHPNIAKVLDGGATANGRPYFVMELVRVTKITEFCDDEKLSTRERLGLFMQVCAAVQHAHQKGIIHRDLKPSNILVTMIDGVAVPKVIDFGIAKATNNQRLTDKTLFTAFEQFIGTPAYMSPEQAQMSGVDIDTRTDIYSLGVVLYELLTGKTPFDAEELYRAGLDEIRRTIQEKEPPKPSTRLNTLHAGDATTVAETRRSQLQSLVKLVSGDLDWIAMKCLEKDRNRRYETANSLAADIQRHLSSEPIAAHPPSATYRFQKMVRRNKLGFAAGATILTVLLAGIGISTGQAVRATRAEREQSRLRQQAESNAERAKQVAAFLQDMLKGVGPSVALGRDTTMLREILGKTAERVGKDLKGQPEVEAELYHTLGRVYFELGDAKKSEPLVTKALEMQRKLYGNQDRRVAESLLQIANLFRVDGKVHKGVPANREALDICRKLPPGNEDVQADALDGLAGVLTHTDNLIDAEPLHREAIAMYKKFYGVEHEEVARALVMLAYNLDKQGQRDESEKFYREALAIGRKLFSDGHPIVAEALLKLGWLLQTQGKTAEAEAMYRECLAMQRKLFGNGHSELRRVLYCLSEFLEQEGKTDEAKILREERIVNHSKYLGGGELAEALRKEQNGIALLGQSKAAEAELLFREAAKIYKKNWGTEDIRTIMALGRLADAFAAREKWSEAEALRRELLDLRKKIGSGDLPEGAWARMGLAVVLRKQGKLSEAETLLREALAIFKKNPRPGGNLDVALQELGRVLKAQGRQVEPDEASREGAPPKDPAEMHNTLGKEQE